MIIVFGSINMDINIGVGNFPHPGETVLSLDYDMSPGGKGANQALACARGGAKTAIVGKVGDDGYGLRVLSALRRNEVMTSGVATSDVLPTGLAVVMRDKTGENQIVVASGANSEVSAEQVPDEILKTGNYVLMQMEIPLAQNLAVMERARAHGAKTILNLSPALKIPRAALPFVDYLVLNEIEAGHIAKSLGLDISKDARVMAQAVAREGNLTCIITLGGQGVVAANAQGRGWFVPAMKLDQVIDTTGAGDCFGGTLAACLHNGNSLSDALRRASVAAGLSCLKKGIHDAYPYSGDVDENLGAVPAPTPF